MTDTTTSNETCFYTEGGQRKGPVSADKPREFLAAQTIGGGPPTWRKGLRQTPTYGLVWIASFIVSIILREAA